MSLHDPALEYLEQRECCAILDFGSQYTQLIARRIRENHVYSQILPHQTSAAELAKHRLRGIVLSGGPAGVYESGAPEVDPKIFELDVPVLGICYGMQLGAQILGGQVTPSAEREYGETVLEIDAPDDPLLAGLGSRTTVWMSHGDRVAEVSTDFQALARTKTCPLAIIRSTQRPFYGLQFHPEVTHTPEGGKILENFLFKVCGFTADWAIGDFVEESVRAIREQIGARGRVVCALSGGVDSSVVALLLHRAIGDRLHCFFIDNGLLRRGEAEEVSRVFGDQHHLNFMKVDAADRFLEVLRGVTDPEKKRIAIGHQFVEEFRRASQAYESANFLAQGTLYPDVIESLAPSKGPSVTIKTHHNVGGLPDDLEFELVEPLRFLFKDEVREMGRKLGLEESIVGRQPFPGPGLAIRILGEVTEERLEILRHADAIVREEIEALPEYERIWQSFPVLLPIHTVGVQGDKRTYDNVVALRIVESKDGMTADWVYLPREVLARLSNRICNEVRGVNRVTLDISSKPPATIEWE